MKANKTAVYGKLRYTLFMLASAVLAVMPLSSALAAEAANLGFSVKPSSSQVKAEAKFTLTFKINNYNKNKPLTNLSMGWQPSQLRFVKKTNGGLTVTDKKVEIKRSSLDKNSTVSYSAQAYFPKGTKSGAKLASSPTMYAYIKDSKNKNVKISKKSAAINVQVKATSTTPSPNEPGGDEPYVPESVDEVIDIQKDTNESEAEVNKPFEYNIDVTNVYDEPLTVSFDDTNRLPAAQVFESVNITGATSSTLTASRDAVRGSFVLPASDDNGNGGEAAITIKARIASRPVGVKEVTNQATVQTTAASKVFKAQSEVLSLPICQTDCGEPVDPPKNEPRSTSLSPGDDLGDGLDDEPCFDDEGDEVECEKDLPDKVASTGPAAIAASVVGVSAIGYAARQWMASRREVKDTMNSLYKPSHKDKS